MSVLAMNSTTISLKLPLTIIQGTHLPCLEPSTNTMEMKGMIAFAPSNRAFITRTRHLRPLPSQRIVPRGRLSGSGGVREYLPVCWQCLPDIQCKDP